jgi:hypothetical protein
MAIHFNILNLNQIWSFSFEIFVYNKHVYLISDEKNLLKTNKKIRDEN